MTDGPDQTPAQHPSELDPGPAARHKRRSRFILLGCVAGGIGLLSSLLGFGLSHDPNVIKSPLVGRPAPTFSLQMLNSSEVVRLSDLRGQVVVVNFWASWCAGCRIEHPALLAAWQRYRDRGVVLVGIPFQDRPSASTAYIAQYGGDWPELDDPASATAIAYGVYGMPETFVIGPDGRVAYKQVGAVSYEVLAGQIDLLLAGGSS
jgi:cytochrome c biogenesis protein CcmG/thiol:disulfide interchange protein DsbE